MGHGGKWARLLVRKPMSPHPGYCAVATVFVDSLDRLIEGAAVSELIAVYRDDACTLYGDRECMADVERIIARRVMTDPGLMVSLRKAFFAKANELLRFCDALPDEPAALTARSLYEWYGKYLHHYQDAYLYGEPIAWLTKNALTAYLLPYLDERIGPSGAMNAAEALSALVAPDRLSFEAEEESDLIGLFEKIRRRAEDRDEVGGITHMSLEADQDIRAMVQEHAKKWSWIPCEHSSSPWDDDHFFRELESMFSQPLGVIHARARELADRPASVRMLRGKWYRSVRIDRHHRRLFDAIRDCSFLLDHERAVFTKVHIAVRPFLEEISGRCGLDYEYGRYLLPEEIRVALVEHRLPDTSEIRCRKTFSVLRSVRPDQHQFLKNRERDRLMGEIGIRKDGVGDRVPGVLAGLSAVKGRVNGRARVLSDVVNPDSLGSADILVTGMTGPEYVSDMRKVAAIVTDEGDMTCHAAAVARELKKPCVVGTGTATDIIRDGDLIEVDADRGLVRISRRATGIHNDAL